ncbi:hypothetical protein G7K_4951-t1 [Saitoella complicata NRRL Y-17804]|uniref:F-box domain-containing protein n=1 Tax=Saitoella complicata (strain BCRC 22490 / CBS 7301 / JCM 7358 / NBRC 10748 / NRRL Y-17804) TaxID=698492 RepID=A0A0E9NN34_SAICN|nr:hypothetical protein G7K_4951-t1 [Saitoella complicata NRRL Y-17804]
MYVRHRQLGGDRTKTPENTHTMADLPAEILFDIFSRLDRPDDAARVSQVCRSWARVVDDNLYWKSMAAKNWEWWERYPEEEEVLEANWRGECSVRWGKEQMAEELFEEILAQPTYKIKRTQTLARLGYDVKEYLERNINTTATAEDYLSRRYHATQVLEHIRRRRAWERLEKIADGYDPPLEEGLALFGLFRSGDVEDVLNQFDCLALQAKSWILNYAELPLPAFAQALCRFMREHNLTPPRDPVVGSSAYYHLDNSFLHIVLRDRTSFLPITLVTIFCALGRRLRQDATFAAVGVPTHVLAYVGPANGGDVVYVDPFSGGRILRVEDLHDMLLHMGVLTPGVPEYTGPAQTKDMILRTGRNILNALQRGHDMPKHDRDAALYASFAALDIIGNGLMGQPREFLSRIVQTSFPSDIGFIETKVLPSVEDEDEAGILAEACSAIRQEDRKEPGPKGRKNLKREPKYRVGQIFVHQRYDYRAVITGWSKNCSEETTEEWIQMMGVDRLNEGREQPFYHVLVEDSSHRYVAEENIRLSNHTTADVEALCELREIGKFFKRYDSEQGRFIVAADMALAYMDE